MPRHSQFYASLLDDEDDAEELLARGEPKTFGMRDWTHDRELLTLVVDELRALHSTLVAVHNRGKGFRVTPLPRPVTALDRLARRRRQERHNALVRMVLPDS